MPKNKILIIDDSRFSAKCISSVLIQADFDVIFAQTGEEGLHTVRKERPDLVLLDVVLPDMSGFDVCRILRESENNNLMPIIMLTSQDSQEDKLIGLELGADDYIVKPFNNREMISRIKNTLRRIDKNRGANPLTGLQGNLAIQAEISHRIEKNQLFAAIYADIDNFKAFNDMYGFAQGDMAIKLTADIITEQVRTLGADDDFIGHIGGDDFIAITEPSCAEEICKGIASKFDCEIRQLYTKEDLDAGYIYTTSRSGEKMKFPIMSISLAIVTNEFHSFYSHLQVAEVAAELKKKSKAILGSSIVKDMRKQPLVHTKEFEMQRCINN